MKKIVIIGAGASGTLCSIYLKKFLSDVEVSVIEAQSAPLKKLSATGNGRCNLSNRNMSITHYCGEHIEKIKDIIDYDIVDEFYDLGILTKYNGDLLYPHNEQAKSIKKCLYELSKDLGVIYYFNQEVTDIDYEAKMVVTSDHRYPFDDCILAFGTSAGKLSRHKYEAFDILKRLNLKINPLKPSLVQMETSPCFPQLKGVRVKGTFSLYHKDSLVKKEKGELLFTAEGVSGIAVMQLSRYVEGNDYCLEIDMFDDYQEKDFYHIICDRLAHNNHLYDGLVNTKMATYLDGLHLDKPREIVNHLKHFKINIKGLKDERYAQVLKGGLTLDEVNSSLQVIKYPHLYALGELLDVAGDCGGYNLHFAFSSSYRVATALEKKYYD